MTKKIRVNLKDPYDIIIGHGILGEFPRYLKDLGLGKDAVIVTHPSLDRMYGKKLTAALKKSGYTVKTFTVPEGEKSKSADRCLRLLDQISAYDVDKKVFIIALGGGVIGDLAGFVAAVYKRGVPYVQVPTTFLAQIDSSIGGKTGIDLKVGKNLVGAFHQPELVFADTKALQTLSLRQLKNGLAEAVKYGVIRDPKLFVFIETNHQKFMRGVPAVVDFIVQRSAAIKADIVAKDEKETKGLRTVLNFGHTVGHAVEAAGGFDRYHHGEAVALGMRAALRISVSLKMLSAFDELRVNRLITDVGLPQMIKGVRLNKIWALIRHDKKFSAGHNRFVLAQKLGQVKVVQDVPAEVIDQAIQDYSSF